MAINDIVQTIAEARVDARSLSEFMFKPSGFKVARRLAPTIDTLQFYINRFNTLDGDFKSSVSTAVSSLNNSVAEAEGKVAYIETTVNNAINNTAIEGGVLADTFVTVTANEMGSIPRNLRSVLSDTLSITDFGSFGDGGDWTTAFHLAATTGKAIYLPDGKYGLRTDNFNCAGKDLILYSENAEIELIAGSSLYAFDVSNANNVKISGIKLKSAGNTLRALTTCNETSYIKNFDISNNTFEGNVPAIRALGSKTQLPSVTPFGFKKFVYSNNECLNIEAPQVEIPNFPLYSAAISNNRVNNFSFVFANFGVFNDAENALELDKINNIIADGNIVTNDDDYWSINKPTTYYCFLLAEGHSVTWTNNKVSGMKVNIEGCTVYDAYLNCANVTSKGNIYKNNANFHIAAINRLMMSKEYSTDTRRCTKYFDGNSYSISPVWLGKIGQASCVHALCNFGVGADSVGDVSVTNNSFDLDVLYDYSAHYFDSYIFRGNGISARTFGEQPYFLRAGAAKAGISTCEILNNTFSVKEPQAQGIFFVDGGATPSLWGDIKIKGNTISAKSSIKGTALSRINANNAYITNNSFGFNMGQDFSDCSFGKIFSDGNIYAAKENSALQAARGLKFVGNSKIKQIYQGAFELAYVPIYYSTLNPPTNETTKYRAKLVIETATEVSDISFSYTLKYVGGVTTIEFTDVDDVAQVATLGSSAVGNLTYAKTVKSAGTLAGLRVRLYMYDSNRADWSFTGLPSGFVNAELHVSSFGL